MYEAESPDGVTEGVVSIAVPPSAAGERADRFLSSALAESRATVQRWLKEGRMDVDGLVIEASDKVRTGSMIRVRPGPPPPSRAEPDPSIELNVVFEDEHLVVVDKPPALVVHPGKGNWTGTLVNGLLARPGFGRPPSDERDPEGPLRPGIVHRIDKDTSGLLVVAKDATTRDGLMALFAAHDVERSYLALSVGVPAEGRIETWHGRHPTHRIKFSSRLASGKRAVTNVEVLEVFADHAAFLRCWLSTGRTHQIRVHLSEQRGTPLLADALYGGTPPALRSIAEELGRQALHAAELGFVHPITAERLHFSSPLPEDMQAALLSLRALHSA